MNWAISDSGYFSCYDDGALLVHDYTTAAMDALIRGERQDEFRVGS